LTRNGKTRQGSGEVKKSGQKRFLKINVFI
jgi:hypothetical protein